MSAPRQFTLALVLLLVWTARSYGFRQSRGARVVARRFATEVESTVVKPVPKVPASAWKWPPMWPFPPDYLDPITDASTYSSIEFNEAQTTALQNHIKWYVEPSSAVLEIGAQKSGVLSPTTTNVKYSSLSDGAFAGKASEVIIGADGNTVALSFSDETFDTVVVTSGIEAVKNPRELFRDVWRVLKPKGKCIICFGGKPNVSGGQPLRMWTTMNDEQKIWIAGSYYQYSTGAGWENIEGFDVLGVSGSKELVFENTGEAKESAFAVHALKIDTPTIENSGSTVNFFSRLLVGVDLGVEAKSYNSLRLAADYDRATTPTDRQAIVDSVPRLSSIYSILQNVQDSVVPQPIKALLANAILYSWSNTPVQIEALRMGLGLSTADEFWTGIGKNSASLPPRAKILLLAELIPAFGKDIRVNSVPNLMGSALEIMRSRFPGVEEKYIQTYVAELVISDFLRTPNAVDRVIKFVQQAPAELISASWAADVAAAASALAKTEKK